MTIDLAHGETTRVIVLLGCRVRRATPGDGGALGLSPGAALRRVQAAVDAYARAQEQEAQGGERGATLVIASGGRAWKDGVEADLLAGALASGGVPEAAILRERCSFTTKENARYVARLLHRRARGEEARVTLVTCDWHMPRAAGLFAAEGMTVRASGVPAEEATASGLHAHVAQARARSYRWLRERIATRLDGFAA